MKNVIAKMAQYEQKEIETKLSEHEIELATIQDLRQMADEAESFLAKFNSLYEQINKLKPQIIENGQKITAIQTKLNSQAQDFEKKFAEIGLRFSDTPEYKKVSDFMSRSRMVGSMTASVKQL